MATEFQATHVTRPGVEVMARLDYTNELYVHLHVKGSRCDGVLFNRKEFDPLFEEIPRPVMVEVPLDVAQHIRDGGPNLLNANRIFDEAIADAEREAANGPH